METASMADIHLLRTFLAVYRAGTFTRAAHELHLTQPAVSLQIRALETQVGKPLFCAPRVGSPRPPQGASSPRRSAGHIDALEGALDTSGAAECGRR